MRSRKIATPVIVAVVAITFGLVGCSSSDTPVPGPSTATDSGFTYLNDGTAIFRHSTTDSGMDALATGELAKVGADGSCLGFRLEDGTEMLMAWPPGTIALDGDREGIVLGISGSTMLLGETYSVGGGGAGVVFDDLSEECGATADASVWIVAPGTEATPAS